MKIRFNILPVTLFDIMSTCSAVISLPVTFYVGAFIVLPEFHTPGTLAHRFTLFLGIWLWFNTGMNFLLILMTDTSIKGASLNPPTSHSTKDWRFCEKCKLYAPPRSWHCVVCETCILKRDHHFMFTACCIGHRNHRYFMVLVMYVMIVSAIAIVYDSIYLWWLKYDEHVHVLTFLKLCFPMLVFSFDDSVLNLFLLSYTLKSVVFM